TSDSKYVAWYSKRTRQKTAFYPVSDWKAPAFTLPVQARAMACAVDSSLYVHAFDGSTQRFTQPTDKEGAALQWKQGRILNFIIHPQQPGVFVACTDGRVFHGERGEE